ncbi:protein kinase [Pseudomonas sp. PDNC002]|uniref:protein kinase n=1 Tax=Pseudomonas sp. PDNC002 TaxID=2811422 RepID=UPI00196360C7|nr:protein kinase [Pseudomonas sp. PDNC002]QRY81339.1 protein kinase [Pseudomonas sp. PDNC002]
MALESFRQGGVSAALGTGMDLPGQSARARAAWLAPRQGRPPVFMLAMLWGRDCANLVHWLEVRLDSLFADYLCTPEGWSEGQAARQVLAALNMQCFRAAAQGRAVPAALAAGILLLQGDSAHFLQCGDVGLLRYRRGELVELVGPSGQTLGGQAELALTQHHLNLDDGEVLLMAPQPLLAVMDRTLVQATCRDLSPSSLADALAPLLRAPGAVALVLPGATEEGAMAETVGNWPATAGLHTGNHLEGWELLAPCRFGPAQRTFQARHADGREAWLLLAEEDAGQVFWQREWAMRCCKVASLPDVLPCRVARRHAYQLFVPAEGEWRSFAEWVTARRRVEVAAALDMLEQCVAAVRALQRRGVHGLWLTPRQWLLGPNGRVLALPELAAVIPGVARQALPADALPLAPELREDLAVDGRADQFALAALFYWLLSGSWPEAATPDVREGSLYVPLEGRVDGLPPGWDGVLARALSPAPEQRFEALSEFILALRRPLEQARLPAQQRWRRLSWLGAGAVLAAGLVVGGWELLG